MTVSDIRALLGSGKDLELGRQLPELSPEARPSVRWWWLSGPFNRQDITTQLRWVKEQGFGGVELAWIYPNWLEEGEDADALRPLWLAEHWAELTGFAKQEANALGLRCDFTFGSSWPFGGSRVEAADAAQTFFGASEQRLHGSWEAPSPPFPFIVNHLRAAALRNYARPLLKALRDALGGGRSALFCDSLELNTAGMWSGELWAQFAERYDYDLHPFAAALDEHPDVRYDYRRVVAQAMIREFFEVFTVICHANNADSRVQCHGAPTDLLEAYAAVDIPEAEALLFPPPFSRIAASAAAWNGAPVVSAESFTCIYGFEGWDEEAEQYWKQEQLGDLQLLADALFANGVNNIVWHGMPYQPAGEEVEFYASVHVGPDTPLAAFLPGFNLYLQTASTLLRWGTSYSGVGVYLPFEDAWMLDRIPQDQRTPGANYVWEMRHAVTPEELDGHHPLWISHAFLREASVQGDLIGSRSLKLGALHVDAEWVDIEALSELLRIAEAGGAVVLKRVPREPGHKKQEGRYQSMLNRLLSLPNVTPTVDQLPPPLLTGENLPPYWARTSGDALLIFFAHPKAKRISYPMPYGFGRDREPADRSALLNWAGFQLPLQLQFDRDNSLFVTADSSGRVILSPLRCEANPAEIPS